VPFVRIFLRIKDSGPGKGSGRGIEEIGRETDQGLERLLFEFIAFHFTAMTSRIILAPRTEVFPLS